MPFIYFQLLLLLLVANGAPVLTAAVLGSHAARPLDNGLRLPDGRPLFGHSKTWRGVAMALLATAAMAALLGLPEHVGLTVAFYAMLGDLLSSFSKRRLGLKPSSMALGLDQVPEALLPLLAVKATYNLTWLGILETVTAFIILELLLSRLLYRLRVRKRPY